MKRYMSAVIFLFFAIGVMFADGIAKKRDFDGTVKVNIGLKDASGAWTKIDELDAPGVRFTTSVFDLAAGKTVRTPFTFNGRTAGGHQLKVGVAGEGTAVVDLVTGKLETKIPVQLVVDGKTVIISLPLSTESVQSPLGQVSGKRALIDKSSRTANLQLAGATEFTLPGLVIDRAAMKIAGAEKDNSLVLAQEKIVIVVTMSGKLTAK